jgi:hypothetical protein
MSNKKEVIVIITAGFATNRGFLARSFGNHLTSLGIEVDLSHVGTEDTECVGRSSKDELFAGTMMYKYVLSEHYVTSPSITLDPVRDPPKVRVRPPVQHPVNVHETCVAVLGAVNTGKSVVMRTIGEFLKSKEVAEDRIEYTTLREDYFAEWSMEELLHIVENVKTSTKVVFYTRQSSNSNTLESVLASTENYKAEQAAE